MRVSASNRFLKILFIYQSIDVKSEDLYWTPEIINYEQPRNILINVIIRVLTTAWRGRGGAGSWCRIQLARLQFQISAEHEPNAKTLHKTVIKLIVY